MSFTWTIRHLIVINNATIACRNKFFAKSRKTFNVMSLERLRKFNKDAPVTFHRTGGDITRFCSAIARADSTNSLGPHFEELLNALGFLTATLLVYPRSPLGTRQHKPMTPAKTRFWAEAANAGFPQRHPLWRQLREAIAPITWRPEECAISHGSDGRPSTRLSTIVRRHTIAEVLFIPVFGSPHDITIVAVTTAAIDANQPPPNFDLAAMAATAVFARMQLLDAQAKRNEIRLTQREAEVTSWIAAGKSDWEIGQILDISAKTVNFHAENVKRKCGVATRVQAIAALYGAQRGDREPPAAP
ncbi:MAG: hypothetical protein KDJ36_09975 [Hyphomicrobiaceae bacterium]|nr:hypothetical protein [Hyphomicrobiaceae bacterium]